MPIDPSGEWVWWFDDEGGNEHGVWRRQPFGSAPGQGVEAATDLSAAYSAGLALGRGGLAVVGRNDEGYGTRLHVVPAGSASRVIYEHAEDAGVGALSEDDSLLAIVHSEHGDARHPALRVLRVADGSVVADLWDGEGKGLEALEFAPVAGDPRLLVAARAARAPGAAAVGRRERRADRGDDRRPGRGVRRAVVPGRLRAPGLRRPRGPHPARAGRPAVAGGDAGGAGRRLRAGRDDAAGRRRLAALVVGVHAARGADAERRARAVAAGRAGAAVRARGGRLGRRAGRARARAAATSGGDDVRAAAGDRRPRRADRARRGRLPRLPERLGRPRVRRRAGELPRVDGLRVGVA